MSESFGSGGAERVARADGDGHASERLGIFGGTFDPVHIGHLVAALRAREILGLDRVLLVVANAPWQKAESRPITPAGDRLAVVEAAVEGITGLEVSRIEIDRGGLSYTADTVAELLAEDAARRLYVIVGADVAAEIGTWHRVEEIRDLVTLGVVDRPGAGSVAVPGWRVERVTMPALDVSSSELRTRLAEGRSADFLVPEPAIRCIRRLNLYADSR
jgi:nicotinate-nucleotide adenylyltransferase